MRKRGRLIPVSGLAVSAAGLCLLATAALPPVARAGGNNSGATATPIQHLVVIFQENVSFDHYFATYPTALNSPGEPRFKASPDTPSVNGLGTLVDGQPDGVLLTRNPNHLNPANGSSAINPFRLTRSQASTCDQDHNYGAEQAAFDQGLKDAFPTYTGSGNCNGYDYGTGVGLVMGYFDGNTVTALWNYAQQYAMSDNSYGTTFGPSTPGAVNLVAGNTIRPRPRPRRARWFPIMRDPERLLATSIRWVTSARPAPRSRWAVRTSATCSTPRAYQAWWGM
jgi:phospholipase C